jgi:ubiquinone/menaquinone biosynthesis C-methylase UbiE
MATNPEAVTPSATSAVRPKKAYRGLAMEGAIARWYARNTRSRGDHRESAEHIAARLAAGARVLEVAPGPGYLAIELARRGDFKVVGLDISRSFVDIARQNAHDAGVAVTFVQGNAAAMPFAANTFDFIVCKAAFKNFAEPIEALDEMYRVLRPTGTALIVDLRPDASADAIRAEIAKMGLGWFNALLTRLVFKYTLLPSAYSQDQFRQMAVRSTFGRCSIAQSAIGLEVTFVKPPSAA